MRQKKQKLEIKGSALGSCRGGRIADESRLKIKRNLENLADKSSGSLYAST